MRLRLLPSAPLLGALALSACSKPPQQAPPPTPRPRVVFDKVTPSVVAILNDDKADREQEIKELLKAFGDESKAPKKIVDVSLRKEPMPHGTGFMIEGGQIVTAAHVIMRPDKLKVTTLHEQTVDAELVRLDEIRDVAILKPKEPLKDVPPLEIEPGDIPIGEPVWALGHTGQGLWKLSWGISDGIASGVVDMLGVQLLLFDAAVYPGFSGGPVIRLVNGQPKVIGVNHAILFTGGMTPVASISSATSVSEIRDVVAGKPHPLETKLVEYAKTQRERKYADLFITNGLAVHRDAHGQQVAEIYGNAHSIEASHDSGFIPVVGMLFNLPKGKTEVDFELRDPNGQTVATATKSVTTSENQRVSFVSAGFRFEPKVHGRFEVVAKHEGKSLGSSTVAISLRDEDNELVDTHDSDVSEEGDPDVDIVVASYGYDEPLQLSGIRASWAEKSYPRRVGFTWFARGTRGWAGTNVAINAFVIDDQGHVVGRSVGCYRPELRPERPWSCLGQGGTPLTMKEGLYDIVFAINDRPVAMWPMEATLRSEEAPGSDIERWLKDIRKKAVSQPKAKKDDAPTPPPPPAPPAPGKGPKKGKLGREERASWYRQEAAGGEGPAITGRKREGPRAPLHHRQGAMGPPGGGLTHRQDAASRAEPSPPGPPPLTASRGPHQGAPSLLAGDGGGPSAPTASSRKQAVRRPPALNPGLTSAAPPALASV